MTRFPEIRLTVIPTWGCNLRCRHCYQASRGFHDGILPIQGAKKIFELAANESGRVKVILHGGEPTLCGVEYIRAMFSDMKDVANHLGIEVSFVVQTNGLLLDANFSTMLKSFNAVVGVSYDGLHNALFRGDSSEIVLNNIKIAQALNLNITAICVESENTIKDIVSNYEWFKSHGIGYKVLPLYAVDGNVISDTDAVPVTSTTYAERMIALYRHWLTDKQCDIRIPTLEGMLSVYNDVANPCRIGGDCIGKCLAIMPNGDIGLCSHDLPSQYIFGNVANLNCIDDVYASAGYNAINLLNKRRQLLCAGCEHFGICHGGCLANAFHDGDIEGIGGLSCRRTKALLSILRRVNATISEECRKDPSKFNKYAREILSCA